MTTVNDLLRIKGNNVWCVSPHASVLSTLKYMAEKDVGALLVVEDDLVLGVVSERDFVRSIAESEACLLEASVQDYMTREVITIGPEQSIEDCMQLMTDQRIRHLPVVQEQRLIGIISIGDVMKAMLATKEQTIDHLENYIEGTGYGH